MAQRPVYPFCAIVGQEEMKLALILATISPDLSGVLIRGEKGTAKSTAVRGLAALLPQHREIPGPYHLSPDEYPTHAVALNLPEVMPEPRTVQVPVVELPVEPLRIASPALSTWRQPCGRGDAVSSRVC